MHHTARLHYGMIGDQVRHINDVANGLECGCRCPNCGARLIARQGATRQWHFAHHEAIECDIESASETALHLLAKSVLAEEKRLSLPSKTIVVKGTDCTGQEIEKSRTIPSKVVEFDRIDDEVIIGAYRMDLLGWIDRRKLIIEIRVTHAVDTEKADFLRKHKRPSVELDLSKIDRDTTYQRLSALITNDGLPTYWIYNPLAQRIRDDLEAQVQLEIDARNAAEQKASQKRKEAAQKAAELARHELEQKRQRVIAVEKELVEYLNAEPTIYNNHSARCTEARAMFLLKKLGYGLENLPDFIQIPNADERAFNCAPWIWQGWIFYSWLRYSKRDTPIGKSFRALHVTQWANDNLPIPRCVKYFGYPDKKQFLSPRIQVPSAYTAIRTYLLQLARLGFLRSGGGDRFVVVCNDRIKRPRADTRTTRVQLEVEAETKAKTVTKPDHGGRYGVCMICGETTNDWFHLDTATGKCRCNACLRAGRVDHPDF